jgi:hypothetical protein
MSPFIKVATWVSAWHQECTPINVNTLEACHYCGQNIEGMGRSAYLSKAGEPEEVDMIDVDRG